MCGPAIVTDEESPVMVWIHGGGNVVGSSAQPRFNGEYFVQRGGIVLVTDQLPARRIRVSAFAGTGRYRQRGTARSDRGTALGAQRNPQVRRQSEGRHRVRPERRRHGHHAADGHGGCGGVFRSSDSDERRAHAADPSRRGRGNGGALCREIRRLRSAAFGVRAADSRPSAGADGGPARRRACASARCAMAR